MFPFTYIKISISRGIFGKSVTYIDKNGNTETREGGSRSWRNNNPGNLRGYPTAIGRDSEHFDIFASEQDGKDAKIQLLRGKYNDYASIHEMIAGHFDKAGKFIPGTGYSPKCDGNNPDTYAEFIHKKTGLDVEKTPIRSLTDSQMDSLVEAMKLQEGFIIGKCRMTSVTGTFPRRPR